MKQYLLLVGFVVALGTVLATLNISSDPSSECTAKSDLSLIESEKSAGVETLSPLDAVQGHRASVPLEIETIIEVESPVKEETPLQVAKREISEQVDMSLDGIVEINRLIDQLTLIAELPIDKEVDYGFEDNDAVAYKVLGTPEGMDAHFLVGLESFQRDGKEFKAYELEVQIGGDEVTFERGAMRDGPRVRVLLDYDEDGQVGMMGLVATRRVALGPSRKAGINAYEGEYVNGISYKGSALIPEHNMSETFGIQNGHVVTSVTSPAYTNSIKPLLGDVMIDPKKAEVLFGELQSNFSSLTNED